MIQQLSIFDLPPQENAPENLFGDYKFEPSKDIVRLARHDNILTNCPICQKQFRQYRRGMKYCSHDCKRRSRGKYTPCAWCKKEFYHYDPRREARCCSCECAQNYRWYQTPENKKQIIEQAIILLQGGMTNTEVAKKLGTNKVTIKKLVLEKFNGVSPIHAKAIALYQSGSSEKEISKHIGKDVGSVVTWLMHNIPGYAPPKKLERKDKESKRKEKRKQKRKQMAQYLAVYKKLKTVKAVADHFSVGDKAAQLILGGCKGYKRARAKMLLRAKAASFSHEYARSTRSRKYKTELDFENVMFKQILKIDPKAQRQVQYLRQKTCDIVCTIAGIKYAIELKTELKEPKFSSCSMQAFVAAKQLDAVAIYCHPNDCWPTESGREVISIVFGDKVRVINENELMEFLHGKAKEIRQVYSGTGGRIGVYEGIHQQAFCAA
jgi:transposase